MNPETTPPRQSALTLRSSDSFRAEPVGERLAGSLGCVGDEGVFVVGGSESFDVAARVVDGRSASGLAHAANIAATERLDNAGFSGHNKGMTQQPQNLSQFVAANADAIRITFATVQEKYVAEKFDITRREARVALKVSGKWWGWL